MNKTGQIPTSGGTLSLLYMTSVHKIHMYTPSNPRSSQVTVAAETHNLSFLCGINIVLINRIITIYWEQTSHLQCPSKEKYWIKLWVSFGLNQLGKVRSSRYLIKIVPTPLNFSRGVLSFKIYLLHAGLRGISHYKDISTNADTLLFMSVRWRPNICLTIALRH